MAENTAIEWADHTFNPWVGCTKVSPACDHCYAEGWAKRSGLVQWGGERRRTTEANWRLPLKWNRLSEAAQAVWHEVVTRYGGEAEAAAAGHVKPTRPRVFCASLADVFDNQVPDEWRADMFGLILKTPALDWLLLTKRIGNVVRMLRDIRHGADPDLPVLDMMPLPNLWLGATICNQDEADRDIPKLLAVPARVRFLSIEPMLGPVDLSRHLLTCCGRPTPGHPGDGWMQPPDPPTCCGCPEPSGLDWVICGGESGPGARPMHPDWARSLRDQCAAAGVPILFKQWGAWAPGSGDFGRGGFKVSAVALDGRAATDGYDRGAYPQGATSADGWALMHLAGKAAVGRLLDGVEHNGFPEVA